MEASNKSVYTHKYKDVNITKRQYEMLMFIKDFRGEHGYAPSVRDIVAAFELVGTNAAMCHMKALRSKGLIDWVPEIARTFRPADYEFIDVPTAIAAEVREFIRAFTQDEQ